MESSKNNVVMSIVIFVSILSLIVSIVSIGAVFFLWLNTSKLNSPQEMEDSIAELGETVGLLQTRIDEQEDIEERDDSELIINENGSPRDANDQSDNFSYDSTVQDYFGSLIVTGYATVEERTEGFCEKNCSSHSYVLFTIIDTDNTYVDAYLKSLTGNSFTGDESIGLGCVDEERIWRMNDSDEFGMKKFFSSPSSSAEILASNKDNPITIQLDRYVFTGGSGAPDCYSHFANVEVVE